MLVKPRFYRRARFWRWAVIVVLFIFLLVGFWQDVFSVFLKLFWGMFTGEAGLQAGQLGTAIVTFAKLFVVSIVFLPLSLIAVSQFVLPVYTSEERLLVVDRLVRFILGLHGPAIFVREGQIVGTQEEVVRPRAGVAFVDMKSAILLEKITKEKVSVNPLAALANRLFKRPLPRDAVAVPKLARAEGPGIVFIRSDEKIQSVADLRRQFRINLGPPKKEGDGNEGVKALTADGIEVAAFVITIFTLGQPADVVKVAYIEDGKPDDPNWTKEQRRKAQAGKWRVIKLTDKKQRVEVRHADGKKEYKWAYRIDRISTDDDDLDLDQQDKEEIHRFATARQNLHRLIDELGKNEEVIQNLIIWLSPNLNTPMRDFAARLWANGAEALHRWANKLMPVESDNLYRFVINKASFHQLVDEFAEANKPTLHRFVDRLFGPDRRRVLQYFDLLSPELQELIRQVFGTFYLEAELPPVQTKTTARKWTPFVFDRRRVFAALYGTARHLASGPGTSGDIPWHELPLQVATDTFRAHISRYKYDDIYKPDRDNEDFPLFKEVKPIFSKKVRYQGVLSYQVIRPKDGHVPAKGDVVDEDEYDLSAPVMELRSPKILRERGIKVIAATFSDLQVDENVRQQRIENWRAKWQKEDEILKAQKEREMLLLRNQARVEAFKEMTTALAQIFQAPYSEEAMAVRLFQALETAVSDPTTRQMLPHDTIEMLRSLRFWLLHADEDVLGAAGEEFPPVDEQPTEPGSPADA